MKLTVIEEKEGVLIAESDGAHPIRLCVCPYCFSTDTGGGVIIDGACSKCGQRIMKIEVWQEKFPEFAQVDEYELKPRKYKGAAKVYVKKESSPKPNTTKQETGDPKVKVDTGHPLSKLLQ